MSYSEGAIARRLAGRDLHMGNCRTIISNRIVDRLMSEYKLTLEGSFISGISYNNSL
jgi:hypothetical protein